MDLAALDKRIAAWLEVHGHRLLRYALAVVFFWFGLLKLWHGLSPAEPLVAQTVYWFNASWFVPFLGLWEMAIGACLAYRPLLRIGLGLMALQMAGTFLPLILLPGVTWRAWFVPTLEGQYIIKNLVLISAAIVVGGTVRHKTGKLQE